MPPRNPNPTASKRPANADARARVGSYTRSDGTRVRAHTRKADIARSKAAWVGLGFSTVTATAIVLEAGVTLISTLAIALTALLTTVAVVAGATAERNKKTLRGRKTTRRTTRTTRTRPAYSSKTKSARGKRR